MKCKYCGKDNVKGSSFCTECGRPLEKAGPAMGMQKIQAALGFSQPARTMGQPVQITEPRVRKQLPKPLWTKGCPVILSRCVIADRPDGRGEINLTIQVYNVSDREVEAIYYELRGMDVLNEEKCDIKNICELDMCIRQGEQFVLPGIVNLPDRTIRKIKIIIRHVCFTDETIWNYDGEEPLEGIELEQALIGDDKVSAVANIRRDRLSGSGDNGSVPYIYYPRRENDYWLCACGRFNTEDSCLRCGVEKEKVFEAVTAENIGSEYEKIAQSMSSSTAGNGGYGAGPVYSEGMICRTCGATVLPGDRFCVKCGQSL